MRWIQVEEASAAVSCRSAALALAGQLSFPDTRAEQLALAVTEAAANLARHARAGTMLLRAVCGPAGPVIEMVTIDAGPGIADLGAVLRDGTSTAGTLGIGLGAIRRAADFCEIYSRPGHGTTLVARFAARAAPTAAAGSPGGSWAGLIRPIAGETVCGDSYAARQGSGGMIAALCDGLGHGQLAATASRAALEAVTEEPDAEPAVLLERAHRRMGGTRGGALAIVAADNEVVRFAGLGNVAGWILSGETRQGMVSVPGIAGHQARKFRQFEYAAAAGSVVVLHSDGLSSRWDITGLPGLTAQDPLVIAAGLLSEAGVRRDDAGVLVLRP
jgi:anti-sigma regulatory factor (Ser/Thr protein kinase)